MPSLFQNSPLNKRRFITVIIRPAVDCSSPARCHLAAIALLLIWLVASCSANSSEEGPRQAVLRPGSDRATLTLSDGKRIMLDGEMNRQLSDSGCEIFCSKGVLSFRGKASVQQTLSTPRGGQFRVVLPDSTRVWLNNASTLTFPTTFNGPKRIVTIAGEAYFEVAKDKARPFTVKTYREYIEAAGASFNVNCYNDEPVVKVSLLDGAAKVIGYPLRPGDGYSNGDVIATNAVQDAAWSRGSFGFDHTDLMVAMRQIARWYNAEIVYPFGAPAKYLTGSIPKNSSAGDLKGHLQRLGVIVDMQGSKIIVKG